MVVQEFDTCPANRNPSSNEIPTCNFRDNCGTALDLPSDSLVSFLNGMTRGIGISGPLGQVLYLWSIMSLLYFSEISMLLFAICLCWGTTLNAQNAKVRNPKILLRLARSAIGFLKTSQATGGYWTSPDVPGITGLVAYSLMVSGVPSTDPVVEQGARSCC